MAKSCNTCLHKDVPELTGPCAGCDVMEHHWSHWVDKDGPAIDWQSRADKAESALAEAHKRIDMAQAMLTRAEIRAEVAEEDADRLAAAMKALCRQWCITTNSKSLLAHAAAMESRT